MPQLIDNKIDGIDLEHQSRDSKKLSNLFNEVDYERLSMAFNEYLVAINSFYAEYKSNPISSNSILQYFKDFNISSMDAKYTEYVENALKFANYDVNALKGENVVLFSEPVIASAVNCKNVRSDDVSVIRLISYLGSDKKFTTKSEVYHDRIDNRLNPPLVTSYKVHAIIWGVILPKNCDFVSIRATQYLSLHCDQDKLELVEKALQRAKDTPAIEIEKIKNQFLEIDSIMNKYKDKLVSKQSDIDLANQSLEHTKNNLESSKTLLAKIGNDIAKSNEEFEKLKSGITLKAEDSNKLEIMMEQNQKKFNKETDKLALISSEVENSTVTLDSIKTELIDANREKNLSTLDMVGHSNEAAKQTRLYFLLSILVLSGLLYMSIYVYQNGLIFEDILPTLINVSAWDILLSRLPLITATTLIIGGLSGAFFFLVKHMVLLNTEKMTMLKAAILAEQITNSLACEGMSEQEILEFKRDTKIKLIMQVFAKKESELDKQNLILDILKAVITKK